MRLLNAKPWSCSRVFLVLFSTLFQLRLCCPPGCLPSVHSCLLKLAVRGSRCWKRTSLSSTASRRSQVGGVLRFLSPLSFLLLPSCCFRFCRCLSGIKFIVLADPRQSGIDALLRKIYEIYSDFALKNPFYSLEMPIRQAKRDKSAFYGCISDVAV